MVVKNLTFRFQTVEWPTRAVFLCLYYTTPLWVLHECDRVTIPELWYPLSFIPASSCNAPAWPSEVPFAIGIFGPVFARVNGARPVIPIWVPGVWLVFWEVPAIHTPVPFLTPELTNCLGKICIPWAGILSEVLDDKLYDSHLSSFGWGVFILYYGMG